MASSVALMFSGGVDSTVAAIKLQEQFDKVHLLTFNNGYGHYAMHRTARRVAELDRRYPGKFVHFYTGIKELFEKVCLSTILDDYRKYNSAFMWCMGCKLVMHARSIMYCREHGVEKMSDGSAGDSDEMVEQSLLSVSMVHWFYRDWEVEFFVPVYSVERDDKRAMLKEMGFRMGIPIKDRYLGIQPSCIPGELYYLPYILFNKSPGHEESTVAKYIAEKRPVLDQIIEEA